MWTTYFTSCSIKISRDDNLDSTRRYPARPNPNGLNLLGPIKNRVEYEFFKKKPEAGSDRVLVLSKNLKPDPKPCLDITRLCEITKTPPYIYHCNLQTLSHYSLTQYLAQPPLIPISIHASVSASSRLHASVPQHTTTSRPSSQKQIKVSFLEISRSFIRLG